MYLRIGGTTDPDNTYMESEIWKQMEIYALREMESHHDTDATTFAYNILDRLNHIS